MSRSRYVGVRLLHVPSIDRTQGMLDRVLLGRCVGQCNKAFHCRSVANHRTAVRPTYRGSPAIALALESRDLVCRLLLEKKKVLVVDGILALSTTGLPPLLFTSSVLLDSYPSARSNELVP